MAPGTSISRIPLTTAFAVSRRMESLPRWPATEEATTRAMADPPPAATPAESDFKNPAVRADIEKYFAAADSDARERVALYRLAWEVACSSFGGRQVLYERFFFGDPVRMASALVDNTDLKPLVERVKAFLKRPD